MNAGLPGIGISGVFYILSALLMPFVEAGRAIRRRPRRRSWASVWGQWAVAVAMVAAMFGAGWLLMLGVRATGHAASHRSLWSVVVASLVPFVAVVTLVETVFARRRRPASD